MLITRVIANDSTVSGGTKAVGDATGKPTYATVFLGSSVTGSAVTIESVLSNATALECDGWYYAFEFPAERLPSDEDDVYRSLACGLTLACTGKPVLHGYAGPLGLCSHGFGATGVAVGHSQNIWRFCRERFEAPTGSGGGGDAPPRFFSRALWGTIVFPNETALLSDELREQVLTHSPFSQPLARPQRCKAHSRALPCQICVRCESTLKPRNAKTQEKTGV